MTQYEDMCAYRAGYRAGRKGLDPEGSYDHNWVEGYRDGLWGRTPRYRSRWPLWAAMLVASGVLTAAALYVVSVS